MAFHLSIKKQDFKFFKISKEVNFHRLFIEKDSFEMLCKSCGIDTDYIYSEKIDLDIQNLETRNTVSFLHDNILTPDIKENYKKDHGAKLIMSNADCTIDLVVI